MTSKSAQMTSGIIETLLHLSESKSIVSMELLSQCIKILSTRTLVTSDILTHGKLMKLVANMIRNLSEENVKSTSKPDENHTKGKMDKNSLLRNKRFMLDEMFQRNASKFAIHLEYENPHSFFRFSFRASTLFFPL